MTSRHASDQSPVIACPICSEGEIVSGNSGCSNTNATIKCYKPEEEEGESKREEREEMRRWRRSPGVGNGSAEMLKDRERKEQKTRKSEKKLRKNEPNSSGAFSEKKVTETIAYMAVTRQTIQNALAIGTIDLVS